MSQQILHVQYLSRRSLDPSSAAVPPHVEGHDVVVPVVLVLAGEVEVVRPCEGGEADGDRVASVVGAAGDVGGDGHAEDAGHQDHQGC